MKEEKSKFEKITSIAIYVVQVIVTALFIGVLLYIGSIPKNYIYIGSYP